MLAIKNRLQYFLPIHPLFFEFHEKIRDHQRNQYENRFKLETSFYENCSPGINYLITVLGWIV